MPHRRRRNYGSRSYGRERALEHIREAERLTAELGGMDQDVKAYFFALPPRDLEAILADYGRRWGSSAEAYARNTIPKWKAGRTKMSGMVAERLFKQLPPRMPIQKKYELAEGLWHHVGPSSKRTLLIGPDASEGTVVELVRQHIENVVVTYRIPGQLERRFDWLSDGDVGVKQDLLNHLRNMEKALVVESASLHLPILMDRLRADTLGHVKRLAQVLKIGKHELELLLDRSATGARIETSIETTRRNVAASAASSGFHWGWAWIAAAVVGWVLIHAIH